MCWWIYWSKGKVNHVRSSNYIDWSSAAMFTQLPIIHVCYEKISFVKSLGWRNVEYTPAAYKTLLPGVAPLHFPLLERGGDFVHYWNTFTFTLSLSYFYIPLLVRGGDFLHYWNTFTFTLSHLHFHTFTLSHFHTFTFTLSLSHFHFHTFTLSLSHFHTYIQKAKKFAESAPQSKIFCRKSASISTTNVRDKSA